MQNPVAVSTWSLHKELGFSYVNGPAAAVPFARQDSWGQGNFPLLSLPGKLADHGYFRCEICHFHIGSLAPNQLQELAEAFAAKRVVIQTLLVDDGDITNPQSRERDLAWIAKWVEAAAILKAENVRVIAGKAKPTEATLRMAVEGLKTLVAVGQKCGVQVVTENWFDLLCSPAEVHHVLDRVPGLDFLADTGNWPAPQKYPDLESVFARASLCHAKATLAPGLALDEADFGACLQAALNAGYTGPLTLIFADEGNAWKGLDVERRFAQDFARVNV